MTTPDSHPDAFAESQHRYVTKFDSLQMNSKFFAEEWAKWCATRLYLPIRDFRPNNETH